MVGKPPVICDILSKEQRFFLPVFIREKGLLPGCPNGFIPVGIVQKFGKRIILALNTSVIEWKSPFRKYNRFGGVLAVFVYAHKGQSVAADNIAGENESCRRPRIVVAFLFADLMIFLLPQSVQPRTAGFAIVRENIHPIQTTKSK